MGFYQVVFLNDIPQPLPKTTYCILGVLPKPEYGRNNMLRCEVIGVRVGSLIVNVLVEGVGLDLIMTLIRSAIRSFRLK